MAFRRFSRHLVAPKFTTGVATVNSDMPSGTWEEVWVCQVCAGAIIITELRALLADQPGEEQRDHLIERRLVWPTRPPRQLDDSVPEKIRSLFYEAGMAEAAGALRAAAVMYRATVEEICHDKGAKGSNLYDKIRDLSGLGVDQEVISDLDEARFLGNWSVHQSVVFSPDEVADVALLIEEAVLDLYVQPSQKAAMRASRKARRDANTRG